MAHWKHTATRCAVDTCEQQRVKGWSTCSYYAHNAQGVSLYGLKRGEPRLVPPVCGFCKGRPVSNAATMYTLPGTVPATLPCPRCGEHNA